MNLSKLKKTIQKNKLKLHEPRYERYLKAIELTKPIAKRLKKIKCTELLKIKDGKIHIGHRELLSDKEFTTLKLAVGAMIPWRKGPFELFGLNIEAEWRSDLKWQRIKKEVGSLQGKTILDIGCNNGYYLYLMSGQNPKSLLGMDPVIPYYLQYKLLSQFAPPPKTDFQLCGVEDLAHYEKAFDRVFCMGILYHHPDPIEILKKIYQSMKPSGMIIIESLGINLKGSYFLFPKNRYLNLPGHWFIPTKEALENMVRRSGFQYVQTFFETKLTEDEQRQTTLSPYESLTKGLNPINPDLTVEDYPAPWRFYLKAFKARKKRSS